MLQKGMELNPTHSPNKRILLTKTDSPFMYWRKDLRKIDQILQFSNSLSCSSNGFFLLLPRVDIAGTQEIPHQGSGSFCIGREVTGFLDLGPGFWFLDVVECEKIAVSLPIESTFKDLESKDKDILANLPPHFENRLKFRHVFIEEDQKGNALSTLRMELQYFFGWT